MITVHELIQAHFNIANPGMEYVVKPNGDRQYYQGDGRWMTPEIASMSVERWLVDVRKNLFVICVAKDDNYEQKRKQSWQEMISK